MSEAQAVEQQAPALRLPPLAEAQDSMAWNTGENFPLNLQPAAQQAPELLQWFGSGLAILALPLRTATHPVHKTKGLWLVDDRPGQEGNYVLQVKEGLDPEAAFAALTGYINAYVDVYDKTAAVTCALWAWFNPPLKVG